MRLLEDNRKEEYKKFLEKHKRCNFQQSLEWQRIKENWNSEVIISEDVTGNIVGTISVLIRKIPFLGYIFYVPRGPICDIHNKEILQDLGNGLKELAKKYKAFTLKMEPDVESNDLEFRDIMENLGFKIRDDAKDFSEGIQPRYVFRLDIKGKTEDEVFNDFHSKTRYNIRVATKKGVEIKEGTREELKDFHRIMQITGKRDDFMIRPLSYFEKMYDELGKEHIKLMLAYYGDKPISGIINIIYGNKVWYLYGASSNEHRNLMPNYLLQWEMIKYAIKQKKEVYDFRGVCGIIDEKHPQYGLYRFKKGFNADFIEFIGEVYINFNSFKVNAYKIAEKTYKKLACAKNKIKELMNESTHNQKK